MIHQNTIAFSANSGKSPSVGVLILILLFSSFLFSQEIEKRGKIIDSVKVSGTADESFALYLPKSFDNQKASPILFVFEPAGRGRIGLSSFVESAEKHGLVLVCSNNSRNGPFDKSFAIADNLFAHVFKTYTIDEKRMFLSGFSGGSRLATAIASLSGQFAGVIACGAGFSPIPSHRPSLNPFLYAAICGIEDMNYLEMLENKEYLARFKINNTMFSFDGGHVWPSAHEINRAVDWLFLQKLRNGVTLSRDQVLESFLSELQLARQFINKGEFLFAKETYQRVLQTYPEEIGLESVQTKHKVLVNSNDFRRASKGFSQAIKLEKQLEKRLYPRLQSDLESIENLNLKWWEKEIEKLDKTKEKGKHHVKRMVERVKYGIMANTYESRFSIPELFGNENYENLVKVLVEGFQKN